MSIYVCYFQFQAKRKLWTSHQKQSSISATIFCSPRCCASGADVLRLDVKLCERLRSGFSSSKFIVPDLDKGRLPVPSSGKPHGRTSGFVYGSNMSTKTIGKRTNAATLWSLVGPRPHSEKKGTLQRIWCSKCCNAHSCKESAGGESPTHCSTHPPPKSKHMEKQPKGSETSQQNPEKSDKLL